VALTLSSCKHTEPTQDAIEIPVLHFTTERPVLEPIPELDVDGMTDKQIEDITAVLTAYNLNLGRMVIYAEELERNIEIQSEYLNEVIEILKQ
jgi:hypothetical protein